MIEIDELGMRLSRRCANAFILLAPLTACGGSPSEVAAPTPAYAVHLPPRPPAVPFGHGMTRPVRISGDDPRPSKEAVAAGARGLIIIQCIVRTSGEVTDCRFIKSIPLLDQAVLDAIKTWRVEPIYFRGKSIDVDYVFAIKVGSW